MHDIFTKNWSLPYLCWYCDKDILCRPKSYCGLKEANVFLWFSPFNQPEMANKIPHPPPQHQLLWNLLFVCCCCLAFNSCFPLGISCYNKSCVPVCFSGVVHGQLWRWDVSARQTAEELQGQRRLLHQKHQTGRLWTQRNRDCRAR